MKIQHVIMQIEWNRVAKEMFGYNLMVFEDAETGEAIVFD